jgi:hypothetical protein
VIKALKGAAAKSHFGCLDRIRCADMEPFAVQSQPEELFSADGPIK